MPVLDWIGKKAVVNHHREVPYRLIHCNGELSAGDPDSGNLVVQGDNLEALKALLPYYGGKVKCIYIDPPYNTGNEDWTYNDNVNSPEIRAWLGKTVGKEAEDLSRHDKWLCMMFPRLRLLRDFLSSDGVLAISIDENELHRLKFLTDHIMGSQRFVGYFVWKTRNVDNRVKSRLSTDHEYVVVYSMDGSIRGRSIDRSHYKNPDDDPRGPYVTDPLTGKATATERPNLHYDFVNPNDGTVFPPDPSRGWITDHQGYEKLLQDDLIWWPPDPETGKPRKKRFAAEGAERMPVSSFWTEIRGQTGADELDQILGRRLFAFPKSLEFQKHLLDLISEPGDIVMDSFAGSGTTGHAVLELNRVDKLDRKFLLIEMDTKTAESITAERLRRVVNGYDKAGDSEEPVDGLGGGFRYCRLGVPLFNEFGDIDTAVNFPDLAAHVFFSETGSPLPKKVDGSTPFIGTYNDKALFLLFSRAEQGFPREAAGNVLTPDALSSLPALPADFEGSRVVYAEGCTVAPERLKEENVVFKQIPYQIDGN